jgi:beta-glucosidase
MANYYKKADIQTSYTAGDGVEYNVPYLDEQGNEMKITFNDMAKVPLEGEITNEEAKAKFPGMTGEQVWDAFIKQMTLNDLIISVSDNRGILDVKKVQKKGNSVAEGPEGLLSRYQYGDKRWATGFPTGPTYTGTFDPAMQAKFGAFYGEDALFCGVAAVNAPGANINRTPYGSRASEYMSEDGILNYNVAANIVGAAREKGLIMNIKHCFLNNQETGRQRVATFCNEQAIREIYLRPFEGALTKGKGLGIMTSYNRIGVRYAACHEPLMMNVMRGEWKYRGLIIDDALSGSNTDQYSNGPAMLHCGTDLFCLDGNRGGQLRDWITSNNDGDLLKDLQRANKYVMYAISRSWMGGVAADDVGKAPWWKVTVDVITISAGTVTVALFGMYIFTEIISKKKPAAPAADAQ